MPFADKVICVVSPCRFQNELLGVFLENETGARCVTVERIQQVGGVKKEQDDKTNVILYDCLG